MAFQVVAGSANFKTLTDMSKALDEVSMAGTKVTFVKPTVAGTIANGGLANFIPSEIQSKIYKDAYLGRHWCLRYRRQPHAACRMDSCRLPSLRLLSPLWTVLNRYRL